MFKVVPDQLRISQGWVRCGNCTEVFDAMANLQDRQPALPRPPPGLRGPQAPGDLPAEGEQPDTAAREAAEAALLAEALAFAKRAPPAESASVEEGYPAFTLLRADDATPVREGDSGLEPDAPAEKNGLTTRPKLSQSGPAAESARPVSVPAAPAESEFQDEVHPPSFVQQARRRDLWRRPGVRAALTLAVVALSAMLVVQYALHDRDRLAARAPALAAPLRTLCDLAGCSVGPPRDIEAIVIDSSTFNKLRPDSYRLSLTLKNKAMNAVAMPALELTLTDSQDQPVLRRVLLSTELGAQSQVLPAASEWTGTLGLTVAPSGSPARVSGYRLLAFYP